MHDVLWAVLWNRRCEDIDEPLWGHDAAYAGILTFVRPIDDETTLAAVDCGEALIAFQMSGEMAPIGSRVRVLPAGRERWRIADAVPLGLGIQLRFDEREPRSDTAWIEALRDGLRLLGETVGVRRQRLGERRAQLGGRGEPPTLEEIWRDEMSALNDRVTMETDYTEAEQTTLARTRAKGARNLEEEERKIVAERKRRFTERGSEEIARFRAERWPAIRERAETELKKYADYRTEVVRLEDTLQRIRALSARAEAALKSLAKIEAAELAISGAQFDITRLDEPEYAEELLRTVELLRAAIPLRAETTAASFQEYRAPTAGPPLSPRRPSTSSAAKLE